MRTRFGLQCVAIGGHHVSPRTGDDDFMAVELNMKVHGKSLSKQKGRRPKSTPSGFWFPLRAGRDKAWRRYFVAAVSAASPVNPHCTQMREGQVDSGSMP